MSVVETIYPNADVADGAWLNESSGTILNGSISETGAHDNGTTYVYLVRSTAGTTTSTFEVALANPTNWKQPALQVRDAETWKTPTGLWVRDAESWKVPKVISVRDAEGRKLVVPQLVIRCTAKKIENLAPDAISGTVIVKVGTTILDSAALVLSSDNTWLETVLTVNAADLIGKDPTDLRVAVQGSVTVTNELDGPSELQVTQIKVELND